MLFNHAGSYSEAYTRSAGTKKLLQNPAAMLTDRGAYLTYLESQLERVTAACLTVGGFQEHINDVQIEMKQATHKLSNLTKLVGLTQSFSEKAAEQATKDVNRCTAAAEMVARQQEASAEDIGQLQQRMRHVEDAINIATDSQGDMQRGIGALEQQLQHLREKHNADQIVLQEQVNQLKTQFDVKVLELEQENQQLRSRIVVAEEKNEQLATQLTTMQATVAQLVTRSEAPPQRDGDAAPQQLSSSNTVETAEAGGNQATEIDGTGDCTTRVKLQESHGSRQPRATRFAEVNCEAHPSNASAHTPVSEVDGRHTEFDHPEARWEAMERQVSHLQETFAGFLTVYHHTQSAAREEVRGVQKTQASLEPMLERLTTLLALMQHPGAAAAILLPEDANPTTPQREPTPKKDSNSEANTPMGTPNGRSAGLLKPESKMKKKLNISFQDQIAKPWVPPGVVSTFVDRQKLPSTAAQQQSAAEGLDVTSISTIKQQSSSSSSSHDAVAASALDVSATTAHST